MAAPHSPLRLVARPAPEPSAAAGGYRRAAWILGALAGLAALALAVRQSGEEERALRNVPPAERAALYHRTMDTLRSVCAGAERQELRDLCREQAQLVLLFPECGAACQATAREQLRAPTR